MMNNNDNAKRLARREDERTQKNTGFKYFCHVLLKVASNCYYITELCEISIILLLLCLILWVFILSFDETRASPLCEKMVSSVKYLPTLFC